MLRCLSHMAASSRSRASQSISLLLRSACKQALQTQAADAIKIHLVSEFARYHLPELQRATTDGSLTEERADEIVAQLTQDNIDIVSISARGHGGRYVARVEIRI